MIARVDLIAEADVSADEIVVRCAIGNLGGAPFYAMCFDFTTGSPRSELQWMAHPEDPQSGWARLYAGGLGAAPGKLACFPARNAGEPVAPDTALAVQFRHRHPVREADLDAHPDAPSRARPATRLLVHIEIAEPPAAAPPARPCRGFDLHGARHHVAATWVDLPRAIVINSSVPPGNGPW